tara:strand:+ start:3144 stop:3911 length:768 start_codon:yes stop_codon:yes gene_type:complete
MRESKLLMFNRHREIYNPFKSVFVLGGTSEIANQICLTLVENGTKRIHFVSRNNLKQSIFINKLANNYDLEISVEEVDLLKYDSVKKPKIGIFDLYIIAVGYLGNTSLANNDHLEALRIANINYYSLIPWINSIVNEKRICAPGAMWVLSSVAGDKGRPSNFHYGASKSALTIFCEGLFYRCYQKPFKVRIIKAGFIDTLMTKGKAPKFLCASKKSLAKHLIKNPYREGIQYFPWWWFIVMRIILFLPRFLLSKL